LLDAHQLAHAHPSGSSADIIAGQILPLHQSRLDLLPQPPDRCSHVQSLLDHQRPTGDP
jgi:hypothetical protein